MSDSPAARLLHDARWMAGLTQAEVANRAGITRQAIGAYEAGARRPSIETLDRLLAGCGVRLRLSLVPEPGLEDEPTLRLLRAPATTRLSEVQIEALVQLSLAEPSPDLLMVGGKAGARLHGANILVADIELWVSAACVPAQLAEVLREAGVDADLVRATAWTAPALGDGFALMLAGARLLVRTAEHYDGLRERAISLALTPNVPLTVAAPDDCCRAWYPRDLDHLALQRAVRLAEANNLVLGRRIGSFWSGKQSGASGG